MSEKEKSLPRPRSTPFGRKRHREGDDENAALMADEMAAAAAEGKLEEFLEKEMPQNEYAKTLSRMMIGMTGMLPAEDSPAPKTRSEEETESAPHALPPEDVLRAALSGDVKGLTGLLEKEHKKRMPPENATSFEKPVNDDSTAPAIVEKEIIDRMLKIAAENDLSLDWLIMRALKLYVEGYQKTGRL